MLVASDALWLLVVALCLDAALGDPDILWRRWPHPVAWMGRAIVALDRALNHDSGSFAGRRRAGIVALAAIIVPSAVLGWGVEALLNAVPGGLGVLALFVSIFFAQRSLYI